MTGDGTDDAPPQPARGGDMPIQRPKRRRRRRRRGAGGRASSNEQRRDSSSGGAGTGGTGGTGDTGDTDGRSATAGKAADADPSPSRARSKRRRGSGRSTTAGKAAGAASRDSKARQGSTPPGPKLPWTREVSAGGVVYRRTSEGAIEVVLASRRTRRGDLAWGLAKGGIEDGESKRQAAIREVREETGLLAVIEADLGDTKYMYVWEDVRIRKTVRFFLMRCTGGDIEDRDDEMEEIRWFPLERALKRAAYRGERDMLAKAAELLS